MRKYRIDGDNEPKSALLTKFLFGFFFLFECLTPTPPPPWYGKKRATNENRANVERIVTTAAFNLVKSLLGYNK
jgi:hypothetical protein